MSFPEAAARRDRPRLATALLCCASFAAGCASIPAPDVPMRRLELVRDGGGKCLFVLLPGRRDAPEAIRRSGFGEAVAARGLAADVVAIDAHRGYYADRSILDRLRDEVIAPARAAGYETIWLGGISLGGVGSLLYLRDHGGDLAGVLALAPYLGGDDLVREITDAGGALRWSPPATIAPGDIGRELWSWFSTWRKGPPAAPLHLGWGTSDRFGSANQLLASQLPPERIYRVAGRHDSLAWKQLWDQFLDRARPCAPTAP